jgi:sigma-B regulation protein RsbQ
MKMVNIRTRNHVNIIGQGEQVVMLAHGFGCDQKMWQHILSNFLEDYRIILFDYVGSGQSDLNAYSSQKYKDLKGYAQDVIDIIQDLNLENIIFIGHSVSSMIGAIAAIEYPEYFSKMIMVGPSPCYLNDGEYKGGFEREDIEGLLEMMEMNFTGWASYMAPIAMDEQSDHQLTKKLEYSFASSNPRVAREFAEVTFYSDYRKAIRNLEIPTLILQCSNDSIVPIEVGHFLHKQIKNSKLVIMDVRGHYPHVSQPIQTANIIKQYLHQV